LPDLVAIHFKHRLFKRMQWQLISQSLLYTQKHKTLHNIIKTIVYVYAYVCC